MIMRRTGFAACFFAPDRRAALVLRQHITTAAGGTDPLSASSSSSSGGACSSELSLRSEPAVLSSSLQARGMCPRAVVVASLLSAEEMAQRMQQRKVVGEVAVAKARKSDADCRNER